MPQGGPLDAIPLSYGSRPPSYIPSCNTEVMTGRKNKIYKLGNRSMSKLGPVELAGYHRALWVVFLSGSLLDAGHLGTLLTSQSLLYLPMCRENRMVNYQA